MNRTLAIALPVGLLLVTVIAYVSYHDGHRITNSSDLDKLIETAIADSNPQICGDIYVPYSIDGITTASSRELCYDKYILANPSINICPSNDDFCNTQYAIERNQPMACLRIAEPASKLDCIVRTAGRYQNSQTCNLLSDPGGITYCQLHYMDY